MTDPHDPVAPSGHGDGRAEARARALVRPIVNAAMHTPWDQVRLETALAECIAAILRERDVLREEAAAMAYVETERDAARAEVDACRPFIEKAHHLESCDVLTWPCSCGLDRLKERRR